MSKVKKNFSSQPKIFMKKKSIRKVLKLFSKEEII